MSTTAFTPSIPSRPVPLWATGSAGVSAVLTAVGTFWSPLADYEATRGVGDLVSYLVVLGIIGVATAVVFGAVVRTAREESEERRGLVLALLSLPSILVFWTGLPAVLAGGAACLALGGGRPSMRGRITLAIAALVTGVAVWAALAG